MEARIVGVLVEWYLGFANHPKLVLQVDYSEKEHRQKIEEEQPLWVPHSIERKKVLYTREEPYGRVDYLLHNPVNETGFGGCTFPLKTAAGILQIKGPWSSRASIVKLYTGLNIMDVAIVHSDGSYRSAAVWVPTVLNAVTKYRPELWVKKLDAYGDGEMVYRVMNPKPEKAEVITPIISGIPRI